VHTALYGDDGSRKRFMIIRLQSSWEVRETDKDILEISSSILGKGFGIKSQSRLLYPLLKAMEEGIQYPDDLTTLSLKFGLEESDLEKVISTLKMNGLIIQENEKPHAAQDTLYDRQVRFFRSFENQNISGEQLNSTLQDRSVLIVGLGGYGSWTALLCSRIGIKNIVGVDFDIVEITNLHRQVLYDRTDLGQLKIKACEKKIRESDPDINFTGHSLKVSVPENLFEIMEGVDFVFNPFSYLLKPKAVHHIAGMVAKAAITMKRPCLTFGGSWIGPLSIPGKTPCYFCATQQLRGQSGLDPDDRNPHIQKRAFAPPIATCCSLACLKLPDIYLGVINLKHWWESCSLMSCLSQIVVFC
jgi:molybdopterin-synthase adenylyltransferase